VIDHGGIAAHGQRAGKDHLARRHRCDGQTCATTEIQAVLDSASQKKDEVNAAVKSLTSILEPILMLFVGALVGTVVISMYLPIFNMMNIVK